MTTVHQTPPTALLVAGDHLMSLGLQTLFAEQESLDLLRTVRQPKVAVQAAAHDHPSEIIIDATMDDANLVALTRTLRRASPTSRIVVVGKQESLHSDLLERLLDLGVQGYVQWDLLNQDSVMLCLAVVLADDLVVGHRSVLSKVLVNTRQPRIPRRDGMILADNEQTVLTLLAEGLSEKEITHEIHASEATVRRIIAALRHKFGVSSTFALCAQAGRRGFVS